MPVMHRGIRNLFSIDSFDIKRLFLITLLLRLPWIWLPLGVFHGWNEAYYIERASHIANGGSYLDGYNDNPPLFTYVLACLIWIFGVNIPILRCFIAFCGANCAVLVSLTTKSALESFSNEYTKMHPKTHIYAGMVYSTIPLDLIFGKIIQIDTFAIMLSTASLYYAIEGLKNNSANAKLKLLLSGIFFGLAVLSKLPMLFVGIPILYIIFYQVVKYQSHQTLLEKLKSLKNSINIKEISSRLITFLYVLIPFLSIQGIWYVFILLKSPSFLTKTVESQSNFFALFEEYNPLYKRMVLIAALSILIFLCLYYFYNRPTTNFRIALMLFAFSNSAFAVVFPNHEYYLLPIFIPLSIEFANSINAKSLKKIIGILLVCSLAFLATQPVLDVDFESAGKYIVQKYGNEKNDTYEIKIVCSSPPQLRYYTHMKVKEFNESNLHSNHTIVVITVYDTIWHPSLCECIYSHFIKDKDDGKVYIYITTDLLDTC